MARHSYPTAKSEPGLVAALDCHAPCAGWVVLYDRKRHALPALTTAGLSIRQTGRWILMHRPSGRWTGGFDNEAAARQAMRAAAKGEDPYGILPKTLDKPSDAATFDALSRPSKPLAQSSKPLVSARQAADDAPQQAFSARAQDHPCHNVANSPNSEPIQDQPQPIAQNDFHRRFKTEVHRRLTPELIVGTILAMIQAEKALVVGKGDGAKIEMQPDWYARSLGVKLAAEYGEGRPSERPDLKDQQKITFDELAALCLKSPATRDALRRMIDQKERESQEMAQGGEP